MLHHDLMVSFSVFMGCFMLCAVFFAGAFFLMRFVMVSTVSAIAVCFVLRSTISAVVGIAVRMTVCHGRHGEAA